MADGRKAVRGFEQVVAGRIDAFEFRNGIDPTSRASPLDEDDEVDCFRDEPARDGCVSGSLGLPCPRRGIGA